MNWTLEDFYAGDKVAAKNDFKNPYDIPRLMPIDGKWSGEDNYYWYKSNKREMCGTKTHLPSAPLSYFISLLDAQEAAKKEPEYIYEPFSEEAAKGGVVVVHGEAHEVVKWLDKDENISAIKMPNGELRLVGNTILSIRRTIETKEVECYVMPDGCIMSVKHFEELEETEKWKLIDTHGGNFKTITVTVKIPKK